ncbi:MAG: NAD(+)/NADH kinase [Nitrospiria bacterium]
MKAVGIIAKHHHHDAKPIVEQLVAWLGQHQKEVLLDTDTAALIGMKGGYPKPKIPPLVDLMIVLGGDGTLLSVARLIENRDVPILGVNLGGLGFLTEVTLDEIFLTLEKIFKAEYTPDTRLLIRAQVFRQGERVVSSSCLNDTVISKGVLARMIRLEVSINDQFVTSLRGDGLILATPTGSTAYSLSAGGPIVNPMVEALVFTPICPHTLTNRPIVIPSTAVINVTVKSREDGAMVTFDGQVGFTLRPDDVIEVRAAEHKITLIRAPEKNFYAILREKLKWGEG